MVLGLIATEYVPDLRIEEEVTNSGGVLLAIFMNVILSIMWTILGIFLYSETVKFGLSRVLWKPKTYLSTTIGCLKIVQTF